MSDLSDFGGGIQRESTTESRDGRDDDGRADGATINEQCRALTSEGERCQNAVTHMSDGPFCSPHARADDVEVIDDG